MKLKLTRPLCFIDIESTGLNRETDRIIEITIVKFMPGKETIVKTRRVNPGIPIPEESTKIHGIKNEDVANEPNFHRLAEGLFSYIANCDIVGYGSNSYDVPLLYNEFLRAGLTWQYNQVRFIDAGNIFKIQNPRDLSSAVKHYCKIEHEGAHGAEVDAIATMDVFLAQLEAHDDLPDTVEELAIYSNYGKKILDLSGKFTFNDKGEIIFAFGPNRGQPAKDHLDFVMWMHSKDFPPDTKEICKSLLFQ